MCLTRDEFYIRRLFIQAFYHQTIDKTEDVLRRVHRFFNIKHF